MEITVDFGRISDWAAFHDAFQQAMGFPDFYRRNNNAWIDCMSYIDNRDAGMSRVTVAPGEHLIIRLTGVEKAVQTASHVLLGFIEVVAEVNQRFEKTGSGTRLGVVAL